MTLPSRSYAALADDSYQNRVADPSKKERIGDRDYMVLETKSHISGYQGTIYRDMKSGEIIVAHRGSEGGLNQVVQDWVGGNGNMVFNRTNPQIGPASALTERALELAKRFPVNGHPAQVSVTGHSQGGTLAQITAAKYGLHGETYNAYGAASLDLDLPKGAKLDIVNHVRATDIVSAASKHLGEVRLYAIDKDAKDLLADKQDPRTQGIGGFVADIRKVGFDPHSVTQFYKQNEISGPPLLSDANRQTYGKNKEMFDSFRHDIYQMRAVITNGKDLSDWKLPKEPGAGMPDVLKREIQHRYDDAKEGLHQGYEKAKQGVQDGYEKAKQGVQQGYDKAKQGVQDGYDKAKQGVQDAGERIQDAGDRVRGAVKDGWDRLQNSIPRINFPGISANDSRGTPLLNDPGHSHNPMFNKALAGMHEIDSRHGRPSDDATARAAGALTAAAVNANFKDINKVVLGTDAKNLFAVEGDHHSVHHNAVAVPTTVAMQQPLAESTQAVDRSAQAQSTQRDQQLAMQQDETVRPSRSMG
ncbi:XVIPCD domain-containing protein [Lysobacter sp. CA199]|uniref:XVIPCD domain-containing protein n=1 Tax=Lysobacter sp. CA199 TaxID=3455608 RepID=UPI003F8D6D0A